MKGTRIFRFSAFLSATKEVNHSPPYRGHEISRMGNAIFRDFILLYRF